MGSLTDYIECPKCGNLEAHSELHYDTGEESIMCLDCGYNRRFFITNWDEKEQAQTEWMPQFKLEETGGHGSYRLRAKRHNAYEVGSFSEPAGIEEFRKLVEERKEEIAHAQFTVVENGTPYTTILIMGDIESFEE
jgi:DNA-directed RNA polymerase subunit RPC12/RpoP